MVMVTNRKIMVAIFTIAIASSLVAVSGLISSAHAFAAKKQIEYGTAPPVGLAKEDTPVSSTKSQNVNAQKILSLILGSPHTVSEKQVKSLSKCEKAAAADGDLTVTEAKDCYGQVFKHRVHGQGIHQPSSSISSDQSQGEQGEEQQKSSSTNGQNVGIMREGFPF